MPNPLVLSLVVVLAGGPLSASRIFDTASQKLGTELAKRLVDRQSSAIAAADPAELSRFLAALHIPGVQLLVISARYSAPQLLRERLAKHEHREIYVDLNAAGQRDGRFFVEDLRANGLRPDRDRDMPFDITWRNDVTRTTYDGDWKAQGLSEAEYHARFDRDDAEYTRILRILNAAQARLFESSKPASMAVELRSPTALEAAPLIPRAASSR
jgi:hypothetical protein